MDNRSTRKLSREIGSLVYEQAVVLTQLTDSIARLLLSNTLGAVGIDRTELTIDELGNLLPELESRFSTFLDQDETQQVMGRLRHMIFDWEPPKESEVNPGIDELELPDADV